MKITIKDKEIELKYTMRSMLMYENITDKTFAPNTMTDIVTYMYCVVLSSTKDYSITYDEFIDYLDENIDVVNEFSQWLIDVVAVHNKLKKN
jgi:hypothetical protein